jgi:hypothetical protein
MSETLFGDELKVRLVPPLGKVTISMALNVNAKEANCIPPEC